jgi:L-ribulose-5-phosphate 3-epimerase
MNRGTSPHSLSRRDFLRATALAVSTTALSPALSGFGAEKTTTPIVVFSKVYQALKLSFEDSAALTAAAGLDGIDCPVRPGGEILPDNAADQLPRYAEVLRKHHLQIPLLTTGITGLDSPKAEDILRAAKKVGAQYYRLGSLERSKDLEKQISEVKTRLKALAALNGRVGVGAIFQNHSPAGRHSYLGGDLTELERIVLDFDPAQVGVAFDIGHALVVHGDRWREQFDRLKSHIRIVYIKDVTRDGHWVPFGQGDIGGLGFFRVLREIGYNAPICLHIEFDWDDKGRTRTRVALLKALIDSTTVLRRWLKA